MGKRRATGRKRDSEGGGLMKRTAVGQTNERGGGNRAERRGGKGFNMQEAGMGAEHPNSRADKAMQRRNKLLAKRRARRKGRLPDLVEEKPDLRDLDIPMENIAIDDEDKTLYLDISDRGYEPDELIDFMTEHFGNNHPDGKVNVMTDDEGNVTGVSWHKDDDGPDDVFPAPKHQIQMDTVNSDPILIASKQSLEAQEEIPSEIVKLEENLIPRRKSRVVERGYERNHKLVDLVKKRAGYACEVDGCAVELFIKPDGLAYVEVHHLIMMAEGGPDTMENMVCVCANHHRELHYGKNREQLKKQLQDLRGEQHGGLR